MEENKRVLLGMSGGTDSSVAAMRLLEAGYEVIGVTFRFYELNGSTEYLEDARNLAERLGIRHITYDAREIFSKQIIEYFVQEYLAGRTPVPCILCNNYLKWPLLAKIADEMGVFIEAEGGRAAAAARARDAGAGEHRRPAVPHRGRPGPGADRNLRHPAPAGRCSAE